MSERDAEEKQPTPQHFSATIKGKAFAWEVDIWSAVRQVSKQSFGCTPSSQVAKEARKLTQILVANLRWVKDYTPSKETERILQKFEQLIASMILAANLPPPKNRTAHEVLSSLSASLEALLSHATPSSDADTAFISRVKQQLSVIQRHQPPKLTLGAGMQSGSKSGVNEEDLVTNFASLALASVVTPIPQVTFPTKEAVSNTEESKQQESDNARILSCLLDYFQEHPKQFPIVTQRNVQAFMRHVFKRKYGITLEEFARPINYSGSSNRRLGEVKTVSDIVIEWMNGPYQNWLLDSSEAEDSYSHFWRILMGTTFPEPFQVYAKFPQASPELTIEINKAMCKWMSENTDVAHIQVGRNSYNQVIVTISCDRTLEDFLDPNHPILPQIVLDHADAVVLTIVKKQYFRFAGLPLTKTWPFQRAIDWWRTRLGDVKSAIKCSKAHD